jgi:hypothetical protein
LSWQKNNREFKNMFFAHVHSVETTFIFGQWRWLVRTDKTHCGFDAVSISNHVAAYASSCQIITNVVIHGSGLGNMWFIAGRLVALKLLH